MVSPTKVLQTSWLFLKQRLKPTSTTSSRSCKSTTEPRRCFTRFVTVWLSKALLLLNPITTIIMETYRTPLRFKFSTETYVHLPFNDALLNKRAELID